MLQQCIQRRAAVFTCEGEDPARRLSPAWSTAALHHLCSLQQLGGCAASQPLCCCGRRLLLPPCIPTKGTLQLKKKVKRKSSAKVNYFLKYVI